MAKLRFSIKASVVLALLASAQLAGAAIFGKDDRIVLAFGQGGTYAPIGRVIGRSRIATGFLVSQCHVLTVKHTFSDEHSAIGERVEFRAVAESGWRGGRSQVSGGTIVAGGDFNVHKQAAPLANGRSADWVLIRLDKCLGKLLGVVELSAFEPEDTTIIPSTGIQTAGFPTDRPTADALVIDPSCRIRGWNAREWLHDCATLPGNSGSPIFLETLSGGQARLRVIAMITAGEHWRKPAGFHYSHANRATKIAYLLPIVQHAAAEDMRSTAARRSAGSWRL